jgi:hypothetical protein
MDPFIENQEWEDFHISFIGVASEVLGSAVKPRYVVRIALRTYQEQVGTRGECRENYLLVREVESKRDVTVIELLSPGNKCPRSEGRRQFRMQREEVLRGQWHLVELDLLRGGDRSPGILQNVPVKDYYALVRRSDDRHKAYVWPWSIRDRLPTIAIPLRKPDSDVPLDLQAVFTTTYDRARYDLTLDYRQPLDPPLSDADAVWAGELIHSRRENLK